MPMIATRAVVRRRLELRGVVQGVGLRPYVYVLARSLGLAGFVGNDTTSAFVEVEGPPEDVELFQQRLLASPPRLARFHEISVATLPTLGAVAFTIVESVRPTSDQARTIVPPDVATCDDCLHELFDPRDRRYRYPFVNCTNCGPRFTIIRELPYDRPATTMASFPLCMECEGEYRDPSDRRFHAEPVACAACGPRVRVLVGGHELPGDPVGAACTLLASGRVIAVKGIGGFHLACDATQGAAVETLRTRKQRGNKPFAVMAADLDAVRTFATVDDAEAALLRSASRPIVLLRSLRGSAMAGHVAPGNGRVGVMLPYSPLHHLLLREGTTPVLVMTSGNRADEPIVTDDAVAFRVLADLADAFVVHDREILVPCDDSVVLVHHDAELPVRRSRGYAPLPIRLPFPVPALLAVGGEIKTTFCLAEGSTAWLSQHLGDMGNLATLRAFERSTAQFETMYGVRPSAIAADLHPRYSTATWAVERAARLGLDVERVQHHHAHIAALMAEHGLPLDATVLGVAFDGTGFGTDGDVWGGEVLLAGYASFQRVAHLAPVALPGGDAAVRHPTRVALAHLHAAGIRWDDDLAPVASLDAVATGVIARQLASGFGCVRTTSMGRLFDAVSSLLGVCQTAGYEAQAAIELETFAHDWLRINRRAAPQLRFDVRQASDGEMLIADPGPVLRGIVEARRAGVEAGALAAGFHDAVADAVLRIVRAQMNMGAEFEAVGLTGGVFQNLLLLQQTEQRLQELGVRTLTHHLVPPNDGGLSLGQVAVAAARITSNRRSSEPGGRPCA